MPRAAKDKFISTLSAAATLGFEAWVRPFGIHYLRFITSSAVPGQLFYSTPFWKN
jgi:hypothetical protein